GGPCPALSMVIAYTQRPAVALILIRDEAHPWAEPAQLGRKKKPSVDRPDLVNVLVVVTGIARPAATFGHVEAHIETMHASARNTVGENDCCRKENVWIAEVHETAPVVIKIEPGEPQNVMREIGRASCRERVQISG